MELQDGYVLTEKVNGEKRVLKLRVPEGGHLRFTWSYQVWKQGRHTYVKKEELPEWAAQLLQKTKKKVEDRERLHNLFEGK